MAFLSLPTLLDAHDVRSRPALSPDVRSRRTLSKTSRLRMISNKDALPSLTCGKPLKLRPRWDRSCTRMISSAAQQVQQDSDFGELSESFSTWSRQACTLRPSVLRSPANRSTQGMRRAHWQAQEEVAVQTPEDESIDSKEISPNRNFRQHILEQVKLKLGAARSVMRASSFGPEAEPSTKEENKEDFDCRKPKLQVDEQVNELVNPMKIHVRPKAPAFPGARGANVQTVTDIDYIQKCAKEDRTHEESDGIYEDDGSSCDSDF